MPTASKVNILVVLLHIDIIKNPNILSERQYTSETNYGFSSQNKGMRKKKIIT